MINAMKHPSAFLPMVFSVVACLLAITQVAFFGATHQTDEGTAAHIWQLLVVVQLPVIIYFAAKYLPQERRAAQVILALQALGLIAASLPVALFRL